MDKFIFDISVIIFKLSPLIALFLFQVSFFFLLLLVFLPVTAFPHKLSDPCLLAVIFCVYEGGSKHLIDRACQILGFKMGDLVELLYRGSPSYRYLEILSIFLLKAPRVFKKSPFSCICCIILFVSICGAARNKETERSQPSVCRLCPNLLILVLIP